MKEVYGKKLGMSQIYSEDGIAIPVTVIEVEPMTVVAKKTVEKEGYNAIVVSFGEIKEKNVNKPQKGIFAKAGVPVKRNLKEIKVDNVDEYEIGSEIDLTVFEDGDSVDVRGVSKEILKDMVNTEDLHHMVLTIIEDHVLWELLLLQVEYLKERNFQDIWVA